MLTQRNLGDIPAEACAKFQSDLKILTLDLFELKMLRDLMINYQFGYWSKLQAPGC